MAWYRTGGGSQPTLVTKSITENGTYNASSDSADGYSSVSVNVTNPNVQEVQIQSAQLVYSDQLTYEVGDYVFYNDTLYVCILAVTTPEPFDSEKWDEVV